MKKIFSISVLVLFLFSFLFSGVQMFTLFPSAQISSATTTYSTEVSVGNYVEMTIFLDLTAQGAYTDETMDVYVQTRSPSGNWVDLTDTSFTEVGNKTGSLPFLDELSIEGFGSLVRLRIVTAGSSVSYTIEFTTYVKK